MRAMGEQYQAGTATPQYRLSRIDTERLGAVRLQQTSQPASEAVTVRGLVEEEVATVGCGIASGAGRDKRSLSCDMVTEAIGNWKRYVRRYWAIPRHRRGHSTSPSACRHR
ncbi:hypothetical protein C2134_00795 [Chromobacterium sinusclupearum]|uniref:Uncharacterized protein n=1 Tax=Chromobacterium sinusclupearum TaxID=2077146 RepID=A0A2K4MUF5_9NEIS|nr:hypothetical protein C2134_00795 [Chromobacterium sinusclupearum]